MYKFVQICTHPCTNRHIATYTHAHTHNTMHTHTHTHRSADLQHSLCLLSEIQSPRRQAGEVESDNWSAAERGRQESTPPPPPPPLQVFFEAVGGGPHHSCAALKMVSSGVKYLSPSLPPPFSSLPSSLPSSFPPSLSPTLPT